MNESASNDSKTSSADAAATGAPPSGGSVDLETVNVLQQAILQRVRDADARGRWLPQISRTQWVVSAVIAVIIVAGIFNVVDAGLRAFQKFAEVSLRSRQQAAAQPTTVEPAPPVDVSAPFIVTLVPEAAPAAPEPERHPTITFGVSGMFWLFILSVVLIGAGLPLQALVNARLGTLTAGPVFAATLSVLASLLVLVAMLAVQRPAVPSLREVVGLPPWVWVGGIVGGCYVIAATLGVPRIGAAGFVAVVVFGQMVGSLVLDHYGILHAPQPANWVRVFGVVMVMAGMLLVLQPWRR